EAGESMRGSRSVWEQRYPNARSTDQEAETHGLFTSLLFAILDVTVLSTRLL
ncbi:hypothetical protein NDU88_003785, partial [Pleurodeles waltl]